MNNVRLLAVSNTPYTILRVIVNCYHMLHDVRLFGPIVHFL